MGGNSSTTTLVIYMPGPDYGHVAEELRDAGWSQNMPCAIISHASGPDQGIRTTYLAELAAQSTLLAPAIIVVGRVARQAAQEMSDEFGRGVTFADTLPKTLVI